MTRPVTTTVTAEPVRPYAKARPAASTRQVYRWLNPSGRQLAARAPLGIFLVALQQLDRDPLGPADEADADAGSDRCRLLGEFYPLGLDLGRHRIDVLDRQPEMIEPLVWGYRWP